MYGIPRPHDVQSGGIRHVEVTPVVDDALLELQVAAISGSRSPIITYQ